jgi:hypothetical protein
MPSQAGSYLTRLGVATQWLTCHIMYHITWHHIPEDNDLYGHCQHHCWLLLLLLFQYNWAFSIVLFKM